MDVIATSRYVNSFSRARVNSSRSREIDKRNRDRNLRHTGHDNHFSRERDIILKKEKEAKCHLTLIVSAARGTILKRGGTTIENKSGAHVATILPNNFLSSRSI